MGKRKWKNGDTKGIIGRQSSNRKKDQYRKEFAWGKDEGKRKGVREKENQKGKMISPCKEIARAFLE